MKSKIDHMGHDDDGDVFVYQWDWNGCDGPVDDPLLGDIMSTSDNLNGASKNRQNKKRIPQKYKQKAKGNFWKHKSGIFVSNARLMYQWGPEMQSTNFVTLLNYHLNIIFHIFHSVTK